MQKSRFHKVCVRTHFSFGRMVFSPIFAYPDGPLKPFSYIISMHIRSRSWIGICLAFAFIICSSSVIYAQNRGGVKGNLSDAQSGEPLAFANVALAGTTSGTVTDGDGTMKYFHFDQNNVVNTGRRAMDVGQVYKAVITNSLFKDCGVLGKETDDTRGIVNVDSINGVDQYITISHNSFFTDAGYADQQPDTIVTVPMFNPAAQAFVDEAGTGGTMLTEDVVFTNGPAANYTMVADWYANPDADLTPPAFDKAGEPFDFGYANTPLATGSTSSGQLGDLRWDGTVAVGTEQLEYNKFNLEVFPVPVEDFATIRFSLDSEAEVEISLYSVVGQKVASISYGSYPEGVYSISWNRSDQAGKQLKTSMYILKMTAGSQVSTLKILKKEVREYWI